MIVDLGSYVQVGGRPAVRFERLLSAPIERVWAAVTDPEQLPAWFPSQVRYQPRVGGEITFLGDPNLPEPPQVDRVLAWDPPHRFAHTFRFTNHNDPPCAVPSAIPTCTMPGCMLSASSKCRPVWGALRKLNRVAGPP